MLVRVHYCSGLGLTSSSLLFLISGNEGSVMNCLSVSFFFFFQAEDGIRDLTVTGVQTCALPIFALDLDAVPLKDQSLTAWEVLLSESQERMLIAVPLEKLAEAQAILDRYEIGRASCRERV